MRVDGLAYPWSTCPLPICEGKEMCDLGLRVGRRMGVNRISFWGRVMELLVCCGALCCVLLLITVDLLFVSFNE